jgi:hypothetical protein
MTRLSHLKLYKPLIFIILFFCLEAKEPKIQDLESEAKKCNKNLKFPNSPHRFFHRLLEHWKFASIFFFKGIGETSFS